MKIFACARMNAFAVALALSQGVVASAAPSFQATTFLLAPSQLGAVATTAGTRAPWSTHHKKGK